MNLIFLLKKWLKDNDIEMYSTHNEGESVVAERFADTHQIGLKTFL